MNIKSHNIDGNLFFFPVEIVYFIKKISMKLNIIDYFLCILKKSKSVIGDECRYGYTRTYIYLYMC